MSEVRVSGLDLSFGAFRALQGIDLTFPDGQFFGLLGPSGSGKTSLLRCIAGFLFPERGSITIGDEEVARVPVEKREIGMVFQNYALFPNMTVAQNVAFGLKVRKLPAKEVRRRVGDALDLVQLGALAERRPRQLSGGQRQRVALARALVTNPRVLLLDEPLSALDKALRVDMQIELKRIQREVGITTIFVTHDQEEALTLSDRIGILRHGRLVQEGSPRAVYAAPRDVFTASFLGDANLFRGEAAGGGLRLKSGEQITAADARGGAVLAVRPESIAIALSEPQAAPGINCLKAELTQRIFAGATATCLLDWNGQMLKVLARDQDLVDLPERGEVWLSWPVEKTIALAEESSQSEDGQDLA